jgi:hypothetical protein
MLYLREYVYLVQVEDCAVVLDLEHDAYHFFDRQSFSLLQTLLSGVAPFDEAESLEELGVKCHALNLFSDQPQGKCAPRPHAPCTGGGVCSALTSMVKTSLLHRRAGLRTCWEVSNSPPAPVRRSLKSVDATVRNFVQAENLFDFGRYNEDCLLRSLSLQRFLRSAGYASEHVIGVKIYPFNAHAWVEYQGEPIFNDIATTSTYARILVG